MGRGAMAGEQLAQVGQEPIAQQDVVPGVAQGDADRRRGYSATSPVMTVTACPPTCTAVISPPWPTVIST